MSMKKQPMAYTKRTGQGVDTALSSCVFEGTYDRWIVPASITLAEHHKRLDLVLKCAAKVDGSTCRVESQMSKATCIAGQDQESH